MFAAYSYPALPAAARLYSQGSLRARSDQESRRSSTAPRFWTSSVGEAEKKVRELFAPAEAEWEAAGDASALHVIILDEMDAIARKRGSRAETRAA